jgi:hypothetical protein
LDVSHDYTPGADGFIVVDSLENWKLCRARLRPKSGRQIGLYGPKDLRGDVLNMILCE